MKYPVITTRGVITFPKHKNILEVGRKVSLNAISVSTIQHEQMLILVAQKNVNKDQVESAQDLYPVGTLVKFTIQETHKNGAKRIEVEGIRRVKLTNIKFNENELIESDCTNLRDKSDDEIEEQAYVRQISNQIDEALGSLVNMPKHVLRDLASGISAGELADVVGHYMPLSFDKKQSILQEANINKRLEKVAKALEEETQIQELEKGIDQNVRQTLDNQQREYLLRERLKAIKEELGEMSSKGSYVDEIRETVKEDRFPSIVRERILEEAQKYEAMPPISAEANVSKGYLDWLIKLPWNKYSKDDSNIEHAQKVLDSYHFGLEKVKERIIEFLAVKANTKSDVAPILTLVGPPGTGKTSLAKAIAEAVNKKFVKISLGGLRDEAEIRGHRRTYVGSMPGKLIQSINKAGVANPLILLDEIDKMSADYKGDPTSAMLEVLDPEQNKNFQDHYLELEYDLSKVMFVATANYYENIPAPLLDRVELIELSSYTLEEKIKIAKKHLIKKTIKTSGLKASQFKISEAMIKFLIKHYTLEAGVRGLQRQLDKLARKVVLRKLQGKINGAYVLTEANILSLLGKKIIDEEENETKKQVGLVTGLAYTQYGGTTLPIEVTTFKGKGGIKLTGQLKDVMKESANIALAYVRSNAAKFNIKFDFDENVIHVHVPEGAIPKDGPSAGVTFTTSLISALTNTPISPKIAMTGEITLRGKVLAIGGLKEKSLAAVRKGVKQIYIPKANIKDIDDIPESERKKLKIIPVSDYLEIYSTLF